MSFILQLFGSILCSVLEPVFWKFSKADVAEHVFILNSKRFFCSLEYYFTVLYEFFYVGTFQLPELMKRQIHVQRNGNIINLEMNLIINTGLHCGTFYITRFQAIWNILYLLTWLTLIYDSHWNYAVILNEVLKRITFNLYFLYDSS